MIHDIPIFRSGRSEMRKGAQVVLVKFTHRESFILLRPFNKYMYYRQIGKINAISVIVVFNEISGHLLSSDLITCNFSYSSIMTLNFKTTVFYLNNSV